MSGGGGFRTRFACLTVNEGEKFRFINLPAEADAALTAPEGIHPPRRHGTAHEIQCHGSPWYTSSSTSQRLVRRLLECSTTAGGCCGRPWTSAARKGIIVCSVVPDMVRSETGRRADRPVAATMRPSSGTSRRCGRRASGSASLSTATTDPGSSRRRGACLARS